MQGQDHVQLLVALQEPELICSKCSWNMRCSKMEAAVPIFILLLYGSETTFELHLLNVKFLFEPPCVCELSNHTLNTGEIFWMLAGGRGKIPTTLTTLSSPTALLLLQELRSYSTRKFLHRSKFVFDVAWN